MSRRANPRLVGAFVLGAVMLALAGVVVFGSGQLFATTKNFMLFFDGSVGGLDAGAPVKFKGVEIGRVTDVLIAIETQDLSDIRMPVVIEVDQERVYERGATRVDLQDTGSVRSFIDAGLRAQLATQSLVTGKKYIAFDVFPDAPPPPPVPESPYFVIPTLRSGFEQFQAEMQEVLGRLAGLDADAVVSAVVDVARGLDYVINHQLRESLDSIPETIHNFNSTLAAVRQLAQRVDTTIVPFRVDFAATVSEATIAMQELQSTLVSMRAVIEPGSPLINRLEVTLADLSEASKAVGLLAEYVQRNPSALLRGKANAEQNK